MYYYDPNNDKSNARRWASLAALLYALSIAAAFLFVSFDMGRDELLPGEGLLIDFGTTETGLGDRDLSATDVQAPPQQAATAAGEETPRAGDSGTNSAAQRRAAACRTTPHGKPSGALPGPHGGEHFYVGGACCGRG
jgi:hypothetical protein